MKFSATNNPIVVLFLIQLFAFELVRANKRESLQSDRLNVTGVRGESTERDKRALILPVNTATGILIAIAVPLDLPRRNIFVSYNFEANYNVPTDATDITPGILTRFDLNKGRSDEISEHSDAAEESNQHAEEDDAKNATHKDKRSFRKSLLSREKVYNMLEHKMNSIGLNGTFCLLRSICESSENIFSESNGVLGNIFHIILTPSSSMYEDIKPEYYEAENLGKSGKCWKYKKFCETDVLRSFSKLF